MTTRVYLASLTIALLMLLFVMIATAPAPTVHASASADRWVQFNGNTPGEALTALERWLEVCHGQNPDYALKSRIAGVVVDREQAGVPFAIVIYLDTGNFVEDSGAWCC